MRLPAQRAAALLAVAASVACTRARESAADASSEAAFAHVESDAAAKDDAIGNEGDAREPPDQIACAKDAARELRCIGGRWVVVRVCHARCEVRGDDLFCD